MTCIFSRIALKYNYKSGTKTDSFLVHGHMICKESIMPDKVIKRKNFLINILFLAAILALVYVFFKYLFWVTAPFFLTFLFAILLQRPLRWLDKKTGPKWHTFWSILLVVLSVLIILVPLGFVLSSVIDRLKAILGDAMNQLRDIPTFLATLEDKILGLASHLPEGIYNAVASSVTDTFSNLIEDFDLSTVGITSGTITSGITSGVSGIYGVVKNIPSVAIGVVIGIIAWIFFTKDYDRVVKFIQHQLPESKKNLPVEIKQVFSQTILKMFRAYGLIMLITFCELFAGFFIMRMVGAMNNRYYIWIAIGIAIFDILPIAGSGGILIPWGIISIIMGNFQQGIGLLVMYVLILVIRQYIEPKIVGDSLGVHPLITLMGLYFGLKLFGFLGMFIVPITVMTLKAFNDTGRIQLWKPMDRN